jgi:ferric-dicitrate binding protein FerR (iron transport regulator)
MKSIGCGRAGAFLAARTAGLSANEQELLRAHLETCADCREQARLLDEIVLAVGSVPNRSPLARERVLERALRQGLAEASQPSRLRRRWAPALGALALGALAATAVVLIVGRGSGPPQRQPIAQPIVQPKVIPPTVVPRELVAGAEVTLAHARVRAVRSALISWNENDTTVKLDSGAIELDVDPALHRRFRVVTANFTVEVLGTRFLVDAVHVEVSRGAVRVLAPDGRVLAARLQMGEIWPAPKAAPAVAKPALLFAPQTQEKAAPAVAPPSPRPESLVPPAVATTLPRERPARGDNRPALVETSRMPERQVPEPLPVDVVERLAHARRDLANGQVARAQEEASSILAGALNRRQEAEARTLLAECAQAQGRIDQAVAAYAAVAERFADLPAGETALFTAARTLADAGRLAAAPWLHRYLDRYPNGRFTVEAKERLAELEGSRP